MRIHVTQTSIYNTYHRSALRLGLLLMGLLAASMSLLPSAQAQTGTPSATPLAMVLKAHHTASVSAAQPQAGTYTIYLPSVMGTPNTGTNPDPGQNPGPKPGPSRVAFFPETQWKTSSASTAVDSRGGMHMAYYYYEPDNGQAPTSAVYRYCASTCDNAANWASVTLGEHVSEVQLKLTSAGQPRLLFRTSSSVYPNGKDYYYAECNANCTAQSQWQLTRVSSSDGTAIYDTEDDSMPQRSFALDPQDRPRFLFLDRNYGIEPDHYGLFYMTCDTNCANSDNWSETLITRVLKEQYRFDWDIVSYPALTFTPAGQPRIVSADAFIMGDDSGGGLYYFACDANCDNGDNWQHARLADRGQGTYPSADIAVDAQGRPRVAFYQESAGDGGKVLVYAWCDADCLNGDNWYGTYLGLPADDGHSPDIELDGQGRPRIAYSNTSDGGLGYAWCNTSCEADNAQWQHQTVETRDLLQQEWPVPYSPSCDAGLWDSLTPTLALDSTGQPRVAYDATYNARCLYQDPTRPTDPPYYRYELVMRAVRWVAFPQA